MFRNNYLVASILAISWIVISIAYFIFIFLPSDLNIFVNMICFLVAVTAVTLLPARQFILKTYLVGFSVATWLSTLQLSTFQRPLEPDFLLFFTLHLLVLGMVIATASLVKPRRRRHAEDKWHLANWAVYAFIAIAAYVAVNSGVRISDFMLGEKHSGDIYKIPGISGIQGILSIFILCCFSKLSKFNKIFFIISVMIIAILDVKRGEIIRIMTFIIFYLTIVRPEYINRIATVAVAGIFIFVAFGEIRQGLYSEEFSISQMLRSRGGIAAIDWIYGYFGITVSVLQEYFDSNIEPAGYMRTLFALAYNLEMPEFDQISILGFNAGTGFSVFAGQGLVLPNLDFLLFCGLMGTMIACALWLGTPSLVAFMLVQVFGLVFGLQLILPYYLVGFFGAVAYQALPTIVLGSRQARHTGPPGVEWRASPGSA